MPLCACPHCRTPNFYPRARIRLAGKVPLECWKCKKIIDKPRPAKAAPKKT